MTRQTENSTSIGSKLWTLIKGLFAGAFILVGAYFLAQNISSGTSAPKGGDDAHEASDAEQAALRVEYTSSVYCPPAGCMPTHSVKILNAGEEPISIRRVILNGRSNNDTCNIAVNKQLATGDVWDKPTEVFIGKSIDSECGTIVLVDVETAHGLLRYKLDQR